jgi:hypothetical protein
MAEDRRSGDDGLDDRPHDVLAADEFAMPTRRPHPEDPHAEDPEAHDVLAADEFAVPARGTTTPDPHADDREPHDVLAADEFAMPGVGAPHEHGTAGPSLRARIALVVGIALALALLRRKRS